MPSAAAVKNWSYAATDGISTSKTLDQLNGGIFRGVEQSNSIQVMFWRPQKIPVRLS